MIIRALPSSFSSRASACTSLLALPFPFTRHSEVRTGEASAVAKNTAHTPPSHCYQHLPNCNLTRTGHPLSISLHGYKSKNFKNRPLTLETHRTLSTMASIANIADLEAEITTQTAKFNELRLSGQPIDDVRKTLSELKKTLQLAKNAGKEREKKASGGDGAQLKKKELLLLKTAKVCCIILEVYYSI